MDLFRIPLGVVVPRTVEAAVAAVAVCRRHRAPLTSRSAAEPEHPAPVLS